MRLKISHRIALGFGLFLVLISLVWYLNYKSFHREIDISDRITTIYTPSLKILKDIQNNLQKSILHVHYISYFQAKETDQARVKLHNILNDTLPILLGELEKISVHWPEKDVLIREELEKGFSELVEANWDVLTRLPNFESYNDNFNIVYAREFFLIDEPLERIPREVNANLDRLMNSQHEALSVAKYELTESGEDRNNKAMIIIAALIFVGVLITVFVIRSIIQPINDLKETILQLGKGQYPNKEGKISNDEIGEMTHAVNNLVFGLKKTKEFTVEVGRGNFATEYEPMSQEDELGHALIKMRGELANNERILEEKVEKRTQEVVVEREKATKLYEDLNDSLEYAKRIQTSFLSSEKKVINYFKDAFVIYKPKDQVSGDFFWAKNTGEKVLIAAVDCTGHGVPGAFVSMVGNNVLNQISKVYTNPASILNNLHLLSSKTLRKGREDEPLRDGMDIGLCLIDHNNMKLEFAGAHCPCYVVRNGVIYQLKGDRFSIGSDQAFTHSYTNHNFDLKEGDCIYLFSDGYADQFGGRKDKKYLIKRFREKLIEVSAFDMQTQETILEEEHNRWKGDKEQTDDVLVIGVRI